MTNNDVLRRLRFTFNLKDSELIEIFASNGETVTTEQITDWFKKEEDEDYLRLSDGEFSAFLNGFITLKRGKKEGVQPPTERHLNNNIIFQKLRIALNLKAEDILDLLALADFNLSKHELSALFRKPGSKNYRECKDQILRNFLQGVQLKHRPIQSK